MDIQRILEWVERELVLRGPKIGQLRLTDKSKRRGLYEKAREIKSNALIALYYAWKSPQSEPAMRLALATVADRITYNESSGECGGWELIYKPCRNPLAARQTALLLLKRYTQAANRQQERKEKSDERTDREAGHGAAGATEP